MLKKGKKKFNVGTAHEARPTYVHPQLYDTVSGKLADFPTSRVASLWGRTTRYPNIRQIDDLNAKCPALMQAARLQDSVPDTF